MAGDQEIITKCRIRWWASWFRGGHNVRQLTVVVDRLALNETTLAVFCGAVRLRRLLGAVWADCRNMAQKPRPHIKTGNEWS